MKRTFHSFLPLLLLVTGITALPKASAADFSWTGNAGLNWSDSSNWLEDGSPTANTPGAADTVVTPTNFTTMAINIPTVSVVDWTYNAGSTQAVAATTVSTVDITGTLTKAGSGSLTFRRSGGSRMDLSAGAVQVSGGNLFLGNSGDTSTFQFGAADVSGGALSFVAGGSNGTITGALTMSGTGLLNLSSAGVGSATTTTTVQVGSLSSASTTTAVQVNGNTTGNADDTGTLVLDNSAGTSTFAGIIRPGTSVGNTNILNITKNGTGTQVLTGNSNTYNGTTTVNGGTFLINNLSGSGTGTSAVVVNSGGTFGGTGSATGGVSVAAGGTLLGGDGSGPSDGLALSGNVSLADMSTISLTLGAAGASSTLDRLGGTWSFDTDQAFSFLDSGAEVGLYDDIITGLTGSESGLASINTWTVENAGWAGTFSFDGSNVDFTLVSVPEPGSVSLLGLGALVILSRRRR